MCVTNIVSNRSITLSQWTHVAYSIDSNYGIKNFIGTTTAETQNNGEYNPSIVTHFYNYFGRSHWPNNQDADADKDEVKIFFKSLSIA